MELAAPKLTTSFPAVIGPVVVSEASVRFVEVLNPPPVPSWSHKTSRLLGREPVSARDGPSNEASLNDVAGTARALGHVGVRVAPLRPVSAAVEIVGPEVQPTPTVVIVVAVIDPPVSVNPPAGSVVQLPPLAVHV